MASAISSEVRDARALGQHRRREARDAVLAGRDRRPMPLNDDEVDLRDRHLVQLDDPDRQPVRQLAFLDRRQRQRRRRPERRRLAPVGRLRGETGQNCDR